MRRFLRLAPALTALLFVFCLISFIVLNEEEAKKNYIDSLISALYLSNWARAFLVHPPDFLGHTWSLSIEEQFYVFWPILLFLFLNVFEKRKFVILSTAMIAILSWLLRIYLANNGATIARLFNGLDTRADALMVGCTVALILSSRLFNLAVPAFIYRLLSILSVLSVLSLCAFVVLSNWYVLWMHYLGFFIIELLTAIVIIDIIVNPDCFLKNLLTMKWLVWIGSISYGLYLWHYPVFRAISSAGFQGWAKFTVGILSTLIISWLSYRILELPVLRLKTKFTGSTSKRAAIPSTGNSRCA
jgi:peptidoglycan/LPS O-acetylase OafA/YrhL